MSIFKRNHNYSYRRPSWEIYQNQLNRNQRGKRRKGWTIGIIVALVAGLSTYLGWLSQSAGKAPLPEAAEIQAEAQGPLLSRKDVKLLLSTADVNNLTDNRIEINVRQQKFQLATSLDPALQSYLSNLMDRKNSRYIAIVAMEPDSGRIVSLAGFDKTSPESNPCLQSSYPAASVFKIVTAAAAVDTCGLTPGTPLYFNGDKYTLYKSQLSDTHNRYTHKVSFRDSFAQSVNPVFGKLGMGKLKKTILEEFGKGFGFNDALEFELSIPPSQLQIKDTPYNWAEIACGFNNDTTLSPVHAAMMVSAVVNQGEMVLPTVIDRILDDQGNLLYESHPQRYGRAMSEDAAQVLTQLMEATVRSGTARKAFRKQDRTLKNITLGGKTGSIFNTAHDVRFDWFVGFAQGSKKDARHLVVAVLVGHEEYIGTRAATYARKAISFYFSNQLAHRNTDAETNDNTDG